MDGWKSGRLVGWWCSFGAGGRRTEIKRPSPGEEMGGATLSIWTVLPFMQMDSMRGRDSD